MKEESLLLLSDLQDLINQVVLSDYTIIILEEVKKMKKLGKKAKVHENSLSAYCSSACTCLTITCTCSSTSHDPTGNYFQGDVKADSAGTIVWL